MFLFRAQPETCSVVGQLLMMINMCPRASLIAQVDASCHLTSVRTILLGASSTVGVQIDWISPKRSSFDEGDLAFRCFLARTVAESSELVN